MLQDTERSGRQLNRNRVIAIGASGRRHGGYRRYSGADARRLPGHCHRAAHAGNVTLGFAPRLNQMCRIEVRKASWGDTVRPGCALIALGNLQMRLRALEQGYVVDVSNGPLVKGQRPSVDRLFASVALAAGAQPVAVLLSGMGDDGASSMLEIKGAGGVTIAQDKHSCGVFGMPRRAIALGASDEVLPS